MLVLIGCLEGDCIELGLFLVLGDNGLAVAVELSLEVEDDVLSLLHVEADDGSTRDLLVHVGRDVKRQVIDDVTDVGLTVFCEFLRDTS